MTYNPAYDLSTMVAKRAGEILTSVQIDGTRRGGGLCAVLTWERQVFASERTPALNDPDMIAITTTTARREETRYFSEGEAKAFLEHHGFKV